LEKSIRPNREITNPQTANFKSQNEKAPLDAGPAGLLIA
jgi:hypothetical protein